MKKALILINFNKPSKEEYYSTDPIKLNNFTIPSIKILNNLGYYVFLSSNRKYAESLDSKVFKLSFYNSYIYRSIFNIFDNIRAFISLVKLLKKHHFDIIHCHTPLGGFFGRIVGALFKVKLIIYTAHGFHFYKEAKLKTFLFRFIELLLSRLTTAIIAINKEDYLYAKTKMKSKYVYNINGVGINYIGLKKNKLRQYTIRKEFNIPSSNIILLSAGDLVKNKNVSFQIRLMKFLPSKYILLIAGKGNELRKLRKLTRKFNLISRVFFLGYRTDLDFLMKESDLFISSSIREGLSRVIMEAMASGLICIGSNVRGIRDLIDHTTNGFLYKLDNYQSATEIILRLNNYNLLTIKENAIKKMQDYSEEKIEKKLIFIYKEVLKI